MRIRLMNMSPCAQFKLSSKLKGNNPEQQLTVTQAAKLVREPASVVKAVLVRC